MTRVAYFEMMSKASLHGNTKLLALYKNVCNLFIQEI